MIICLVCLGNSVPVKKQVKKSTKPVFSVANDAASQTKTKPKPLETVEKKDSLVDTVSLVPKTNPVSYDSALHRDTAVWAISKNSVTQRPQSPIGPIYPVAIPDTQKTPEKSSGAISKQANHKSQELSIKNKNGGSGKSWQILVFLCSLGIAGFVFVFVKKQRGSARFLTTTRLSVMDKEVQRACRFIEKNYANPGLDAQIICKELITGEAFLECLIRRDLGVSIAEFITHVRINNAKRLIESNGKVPAETMALQIGFAKTEDFEAAFLWITGTAFNSFPAKANQNVPEKKTG